MTDKDDRASIMAMLVDIIILQPTCTMPECSFVTFSLVPGHLWVGVLVLHPKPSCLFSFEFFFNLHSIYLAGLFSSS